MAKLSGADIDFVLAKKFFEELQTNNHVKCDTLAQYLQQKSNLEHERIVQLLKVIDKNNDNQISWAEFVKGFPLLSPFIAPPTPQPALSRSKSSAILPPAKSVGCWIHKAKHLNHHLFSENVDSIEIYCAVHLSNDTKVINKTSCTSFINPSWTNACFILNPSNDSASKVQIITEVFSKQPHKLIGRASFGLDEVSGTRTTLNYWRDLKDENRIQTGELQVSLIWLSQDKKPDEWGLPRFLRKEWSIISSDVEKLAQSEGRDFPDNTMKILSTGHSINSQLPSLSKVVRIFTSSTFTDTAKERNRLMIDVYPFLNDICNKLGLEFEVVDMRWGVREFSTDDHLTGRLCMKELSKCLQRSIGPAFINLLGDKYGFRPFEPKKLEKVWVCTKELEIAYIRENLKTNPNVARIVTIIQDVPLCNIWNTLEMNQLSSAVEKDLLLIPRWFLLDTNSVPPVYNLQRVSKYIPEFLSSDNSVGGPARGRWWGIFERLQELLRVGVRNTELSEHDKQGFFISVTEEEVHNGILNNLNRDKQSFCFLRSTPDIDSIAHSSQISARRDWIDVKGNEIDKDARTLLLQLKDNKLQSSGLASERVYKFEIDLTSDTSHTEKYLREFCDLFCKIIVESIISSFKEQHIVIIPLTMELIHHHEFRERKIEAVCETPSAVSGLMQCFEKNTGLPIIVYGRSGSGKTTVMACVINELSSKFPDAAIVYRFVGTSMYSSDLHSVLTSICEQIKVIYKKDKLIVPTAQKDLVECFQNLMMEESEERLATPLYVIIDSLDQFLGSQDLRWIPTILSASSYLAVSLLPELAVSLKSRIPYPESHFEISDFDPLVAKSTFHSWMKKENRTVTTAQENLLLSSFSKSPVPLYLRIATDLALNWNSYTPLSDIFLGNTVRNLVNTIFEKLERKHGVLLVSRALGVISAARQGIGAKNVEDIISCDDSVLNDVYQWWTPPMRRLPPLLWKRLRDDLEGYLIEAGACGVMIYRWYHRQFIEAAQERYLSDQKSKQIAHSMLAQYFLGGKFADRLVEAQPIRYSEEGRLNLQKLSELPYHQILSVSSLSPSYDVLKATLFDFEFLEAKAEAGMWGQLDEDFSLAVSVLKDNNIQDFKQWFDQVKVNLHLFPNQALQSALHFPNSSFVCQLGEQQRKSASIHSYKDMIHWRQKPQNKHLCKMTLSEHSNNVGSSVFAPDGEIFVTGSGDNTAIVWETKSGRRLQTFELPSNVKILDISSDGAYLLANFHLWELKTGKLVHQFEGDENSATIGKFSKDSTRVLTGELRGLPKLWDLQLKTLIHALPHCEDDLESVDNAAISLDGAFIATGSFDFRVWNSLSGAMLIHYNEEFGCHSSAISPNNKYALCGLGSGIILQFDLNTGKVIQSFEGHGDYVNCCVVTQDSSRIVASGNEMIKVWDANSGKCIASWTAHENKIRDLLIAPNQQFIVSFADNEAIAKVWDFNGTLQRSMVGHLMSIRSCSISPDSSVLVSTSSDGTVRLWDLVSPHSLPDPPPHSSEILYCGLSRSGKHIVSASEDGKMNVWITETHQIIHSLPHPNQIVSCMTLTGDLFISRDKEGIARIWDIANGTLIHTLPIPVHQIAVSDDSQIILAITKQGIIHNIEPLTWRTRWQINSDVAEIRSVRISSKNSYFVYSSTRNYAIFLHSITDGQLVYSFSGHSDIVDSTVFSPDETVVISGARDGTAKLWKTNGGEGREVLKTNGWVFGLTFSPNGKFLLSAGEDQHLRVWDCESWCLLWSTKIGLLNKSKWVSSEQVMLQTPDAIVIYHIPDKKVTGSWFFSVICDADLISKFSNNSNSNISNNSTLSTVSSGSALMVAGTSSGDVYSFDI